MKLFCNHGRTYELTEVGVWLTALMFFGFGFLCAFALILTGVIY